MNYYPHHIGDYSRKTAHLTFAEDAAYRRMLDLYYSSERPLPGNKAGLYRLLRARTKDEQRAVDTVLLEYFEERDGSWHNDRADEEIAKWQAKAAKAKQSAGVRWHSERNANALETHGDQPSERNANQNQEPKPESRTPRASRLGLDELPGDWEAFCREERPDLNPTDTFSRFRDYWIAKAGKDGRKADWLATWRNWVRNERKTAALEKTVNWS